jgi:hypothetical protein
MKIDIMCMNQQSSEVENKSSKMDFKAKWTLKRDLTEWNKETLPLVNTDTAYKYGRATWLSWIKSSS